jgi:hypothetical protein
MAVDVLFKDYPCKDTALMQIYYNLAEAERYL